MTLSSPSPSPSYGRILSLLLFCLLGLSPLTLGQQSTGGGTSGGGGSGTVTTTGSPANGNLTAFSGPTSITPASAHNASAPLVCAAASGSPTAYTCTTSPSFTPADGDLILFQADVANTGAATLNVNSTSATAILKQQGNAALVANDLLIGGDVILEYTGTNWQMQGQTGNAGTAAFNAITSGTNTTATMTVGSGATLNGASGVFDGTWIGGPTATIANSPSGATETGTTVTITTTAPCTFTSGMPVNISGVGVSGYNGNYIILTSCSGGSTFTYYNASGLSASGGGTVTGSPIHSSGLSVQGLLTTGTGLPANSPISPLNLGNYCSTPTGGPLTTFLSGVITPCTTTSMYLGVHQTAAGIQGFAHRNDLVTAAGVDVQSAVSIGNYADCYGMNSGGVANDNNTACIGEFDNASNLSTTSSVSIVGIDSTATSLFTGLGTHLVQAQQNLASTARAPGWYGDTGKDFSPMNTNNIFAGSQNITAYLGMDSGAAGKGALIGEYVASTIQAAHAVLSGTVNPDTGYWCSISTTACFYATSAPLYATSIVNPTAYGNQGTYSFLSGESAVTSGVSGVSGWVSTNATGTAFTISTVSQVGPIATFTTSTTCTYTTGQPVTIAGVTLSGYNGNFIVLSPGCNGGSTFSVNNTAQQATNTGTVSTATESSTTVTLTMTGTCTYTTGMIVTVSGVPIAAPTANIGYNGAYTVLTPGCNGGSSFTYTSPLSGLASQSGGTVSGPIPASTGGTATGGVRQVWTQRHTADGVLHLGWCNAFPCVGTDKMILDSNGNLGSLNTAAAISFSGIYVTSTATPAQSGEIRLASTDAINWRNNANNADVGLSKNTSDVFSLAGNPVVVNATNAFGNVPTAINCALTSAATCLTVGETSAATTAGAVDLQITAASGSTAIPLQLTQSLTGSQTLPALSIIPTWNTSGGATAALINVTNTASLVGSSLFSMQLGGANFARFLTQSSTPATAVADGPNIALAGSLPEITTPGTTPFLNMNTLVNEPLSTCHITAAITLTVQTTICSWTLPNTAKAWSFQCQGSYSTSTTAISLTLGSVFSQAPSTGYADATIFSGLAGTSTSGGATNTGTLATTILAGSAPASATSNVPWLLSGTFTGSATSGTFIIYGTPSTTGDITIRGTCTLQ
jgi:hypothetical protein